MLVIEHLRGFPWFKPSFQHQAVLTLGCIVELPIGTRGVRPEDFVPECTQRLPSVAVRGTYFTARRVT